MNETTNSSQPARRPRWLRRILITLGVLVLLPIILVLGVSFYLRVVGGQRLAEAVARIEKSELVWQLDQLEAERPAVPDEENAARCVLTVVQKMPRSDERSNPADSPGSDFKNWSSKFQDELKQLSPVTTLNERQSAQLRAELKKFGPALVEAQRLTELSKGRFPESTDPLGAQHSLSVGTVSHLLRLDAVLRAHDGDADDAILSLIGVLNAGRSIGDDPHVIAQFTRVSCGRWAVNGIERVLAQGQPSEKVLTQLQKLLEDEAKQPLFLISARAQRAEHHRYMTALREGTYHEFLTGADAQEHVLIQKSIPGKIERWLKTGWIQENHGVLLEYLTDAVEIAQQPLGEQYDALGNLKRKHMMLFSDTNIRLFRYALVKTSMPAFFKIGEGCLNNQAMLGSASLAVAAERYRLVHRHWPESLEQLIPDYITKVPDDPFGKGSLRLRRLEDGIVIYSVGVDGKDDGGLLNQKRYTPGDLGVRLRDVDRRGQKPPPEPEQKAPVKSSPTPRGF